MILPLLGHHGQHLVSIHLQEVADVHIQLIIHLCPVLVHLQLLFCLSYTCKQLPVGGKLPKKLEHRCLRTLTLLNNSDTLDDESATQPTKEDLAVLLGTESLTEVSLGHCDFLTDELLEEIRARNNFQCLSSLSLQSCNNISMTALLPVLLGNNDLTSVTLLDCDCIHLKDFQRYEKMLKRMGFDSLVRRQWK